jgi:hypothetical protein
MSTNNKDHLRKADVQGAAENLRDQAGQDIMHFIDRTKNQPFL